MAVGLKHFLIVSIKLLLLVILLLTRISKSPYVSLLKYAGITKVIQPILISSASTSNKIELYSDLSTLRVSIPFANSAFPPMIYPPLLLNLF